VTTESEIPSAVYLRLPYSFELANGKPMGFAGLCDAWKDKHGYWLQSFAIVTTEANELMARIHSRMPCILHPRDYDRWLDLGKRRSDCRSIRCGHLNRRRWRCLRRTRR
jgi:putative SOS response-associated peptidase YedK